MRGITVKFFFTLTHRHTLTLTPHSLCECRLNFCDARCAEVLVRQKHRVPDDATGLPVTLQHRGLSWISFVVFSCTEHGADVAANSNTAHCPGLREQNTAHMEFLWSSSENSNLTMPIWTHRSASVLKSEQLNSDLCRMSPRKCAITLSTVHINL